MIFPAITTTRDKLGRVLYWFYASPVGPRVKVSKVWAEMMIRKRLVVDKRSTEVKAH